MKKYIFSVLMAAMAAFTFSSCEDVPEPYTQPTKPDASGTTEGEPKGTGTAADPFNSIAAINYCNTLEAGVESDKEVYIKGKVVSIKEQFSTSFGNGSFYIADDESSEKFYIFRSLYLGNKKWTASDPELKEGDEVVVCAKVMNYMGNTPETVANKTYLVSLNGKTADGSGSGDITGTAKGDGSAANPFNSVAAQKYTAALEPGVVSDKEFYIKGKVQSIKEQFSASYGNGSFYIADDANSTQFYIFRIYYFGGEKWKEGDMTLKEGDEIVVCAKLINYMGNTPETNQGGKLISVNGKTSAGGGEVKPDPTPDTPATGDAMNISSIVSGKTSSEDLPENAYGSQVAATESTWYSWKFDNIAYSGARICKANGDFTGTLQLQGNASDAAKQGFLFNSTAFSKDIKSITIVVKGLSKYDTPTVFGVYHGSSAHPTTDAIKGSYTKETGSTLNSFTFTYDFSSVSSKYFTIWNNAVGALYIEKIIITLK